MDFNYTYNLLLISYLYLVLDARIGAQELHASMRSRTAIFGVHEGRQAGVSGEHVVVGSFGEAPLGPRYL